MQVEREWRGVVLCVERTSLQYVYSFSHPASALRSTSLLVIQRDDEEEEEDEAEDDDE